MVISIAVRRYSYTDKSIITGTRYDAFLRKDFMKSDISAYDIKYVYKIGPVKNKEINNFTENSTKTFFEFYINLDCIGLNICKMIRSN